MDETLKKTVETLLFITDKPLSAGELRRLCEAGEEAEVLDAVREIREKLADSALQVVEVAGGFQMATRPDYAASVRRLFSDRMTTKLSAAALETLAIIAYRQPLTRAEIEQIRGVDVIAALETLLEKRLVKVVGRRETIGRPLLYGTTTDFLRRFGLKDASDLPPIESFAAAVEAQAEQSPAALGTASPPGAAVEAQGGAAPDQAPREVPVQEVTVSEGVPAEAAESSSEEQESV